MLIALITAAGTAHAATAIADPAAPLILPEVGSKPAKMAQTTRNRLATRGISYGFNTALEGYDNFHGGKRTGQAGASTIDAYLSLDAGKLWGVTGGNLYADIEDHAGGDPSNSLVGDLQVFDKHNAAPFLQVMEVWYQQILFHNTLRLKVGKVDSNTEFSVIDNGLDFLNSSTQVTPTFFVFPTYPDPMPSVNLFYTPDKLFYAGLGIYDANRSARFLDFLGNPASVQPTQHGLLYIGETGLTWQALPGLDRSGNLRMGEWRHTGTFADNTGAIQHGTDGYYLILDQTLWQPAFESADSRGIRIFLEYAHANGNVAPVYRHIGGGLEWTGPWTARPHDVAGFSVQYVQPSPALHLPKAQETAFETFYRMKLMRGLTLEPDLQYIVNPGAFYPDAWVGTLLLKLSF